MAHAADAGNAAHARLLYASQAPAPVSSRDLMEILEIARFRNRSAQITGLLCFSSQHFLQVLEGPPGPVCETFYRILRDPRHTQVRLLQFSHSPERLFDDWSMGFAGVGAISSELVARHSPTGEFSAFATAPDAAVAFVTALGPLLADGDLTPDT